MKGPEVATRCDDAVVEVDGLLVRVAMDMWSQSATCQVDHHYGFAWLRTPGTNGALDLPEHVDNNLTPSGLNCGQAARSLVKIGL